MRETASQAHFAEVVTACKGDSVWMRDEDAAGELRSIVRDVDAVDFEFLTGVVAGNGRQT